jgi:hypothetical protein
VAMKKIVMIFPDITSMANFIIREKIKGAEVNSFEKILAAPMNDKQIVSAETLYGAILKAIIPIN